MHCHPKSKTMQITIRTERILKVLYIISWVLFVGICIKASAFLLNAVCALVKPELLRYLWKPVDMPQLLQYDHGYFFVVMLIITIVHVLKALMFYLIIKILSDKKLDMALPFNQSVQRFILSIAYLSFSIGLFSSWGSRHAEWLGTKGVTMPDMETMQLGGADVWLFMGIILFVIAQIFKRGMEIQSEHELTV